MKYNYGNHGFEKGVITATGGLWPSLMGNIFGPKGVFSFDYIYKEVLEEKQLLESKDRFNLKAVTDRINNLQKIINMPEPKRYGITVYDCYEAQGFLQKDRDTIDVRLQSRCGSEALKRMSYHFLKAGYSIKYREK